MTEEKMINLLKMYFSLNEEDIVLANSILVKSKLSEDNYKILLHFYFLVELDNTDNGNNFRDLFYRQCGYQTVKRKIKTYVNRYIEKNFGKEYKHKK